MKVFTARRVVLLIVAMILLGMKTISCDAGGIGGMLGLDEGCEGFETLEPGVFPQSSKIQNLGQIRLSSHAFSFIEQEGLSLMKMFLDTDQHGNAVIPLEDPMALGGICELCPDGCQIPLPIQEIKITPYDPPKNYLEATITISQSAEITLPTSCASCIIDLDFDHRPFVISVIIQFSLDPKTGQLDIDVAEPIFDYDQINIGLGGEAWYNTLYCAPLGAILNTIVKPLVEGLLKGFIRDMLEEMVDGFKCVNCDDEHPCADPDQAGITCSDEICRRANGECVLMPLGLEAIVDVGSLTADLLPGLSAEMWLSVLAGGKALVNEGGLSLGIAGGTAASKDLPGGEDPPCITYMPYKAPDLSAMDLGNVNDNVTPSERFHAGIGLQEAILDQAGYTLQNSGLLCMSLDPSILGEDVSMYLSVPNLGLLIQSIPLLTHGENTPLLLKMQPSKIPVDFAIMNGAKVFPDYTGESETTERDVVANKMDLALQVRIRSLGINFLAMVDERFIRLFELNVDIDVTAGIDVDKGAITPVFGLDNLEITRMEVPYSVLTEGEDDIVPLLEGLLGQALGMVKLEPFDPIAIDPFDLTDDGVPDLALAIQSISPIDPKDSGPATETTEYNALAVYANLEIPTTTTARQSLPPEAETIVNVVDRFVPTPAMIRNDGVRPWIELSFDGEDASGGREYLEYSVSLNGKMWTGFSPNLTRRIKSKSFLIEGTHKIFVRARDSRFPLSYDRTPEIVSFTVDMQPPTVKVVRDGGLVRFMAEDNLSRKQELLYRFRINGGSWSDWNTDDKLDLTTRSDYPLTVEAEVRDESGMETQMTRVFRKPLGRSGNTTTVALGAEGSGQAMVPSSDVGCSSNSGAAAWLALLIFAGLILIRRKATAILPVLALVTLGIATTGCDSSSSKTCVTNSDCGVGEVCLNNQCVPAGDSNLDGDGIDIPEAEEEIIDGDTESEGGAIPCGEDGSCPPCYYCSSLSNECKVQACDPECTDESLSIQSCPDQMTLGDGNPDTCAVCKMDAAIYECYVPRCETDDDCACRECSDGIPPMCRVATGECYCPSICGGGCAEGDLCCTGVNPAGDCHTCPHWCEGLECDPGFAPGGCNPEKNPEDCHWASQWEYCTNFDYTTCEFTAPGIIGDSSCTCLEKPAITVNDFYFGTHSDMVVYDEKDIWISAYTETYGDLMVGRSHTTKLTTEDPITWFFLDGVPLDADPTEGPSGLRGGITEEGADVGKYTSIAVTSDGWPRIAYRDNETGDLVLIYTNGEPPDDNPVEDGDEDSVQPADGDEDGVEDTDSTEDAEVDETATRRFTRDTDGDEDGEGEAPEYPEYKWTRVVVDDTGDTGYYTDIWVDANDRVVIAYMMASDQKEASDTAGTKSALKLAYATELKPTTKDHFKRIVLDEAAIGPKYPEFKEAKEGETPEKIKYPKEVTYGTGINPTIAALPGGEFWVFYYHHTTFETRTFPGETEEDPDVDIPDNYLEGNLMRVRMDGILPEDPNTLSETSFVKEIFLGTDGTDVDADVGQFNGFDYLGLAGGGYYYVVAYYNRTVNQLEFVYDKGEGLQGPVLADDGWRKNRVGDKYNVWLGADCSVVMDMNSYINVAYQNQFEGKLEYYIGDCPSDGPVDLDSDGKLDECYSESQVSLLAPKEDNSQKFWGRSYGYFPTMKMYNTRGDLMVGSYVAEMTEIKTNLEGKEIVFEKLQFRLMELNITSK